MRIFVKNLQSELEEINIEPDATVGELKLEIDRSIGLPPCMQRVVFKGKQISDVGVVGQPGWGQRERDARTVTDNYIREDDLVVLCHRVNNVYARPAPCQREQAMFRAVADADLSVVRQLLAVRSTTCAICGNTCPTGGANCPICSTHCECVDGGAWMCERHEHECTPQHRDWDFSGCSHGKNRGRYASVQHMVTALLIEAIGRAVGTDTAEGHVAAALMEWAARTFGAELLQWRYTPVLCRQQSWADSAPATTDRGQWCACCGRGSIAEKWADLPVEAPLPTPASTARSSVFAAGGSSDGALTDELGALTDELDALIAV